MDIREYSEEYQQEALDLYQDAGWTAYTADIEALCMGFAHSLCILTAFADGRLVGLIRAVGDGHTVVWIQDVLVRSDYRRKGIGKALVRALCSKYSAVRQIMLASDETEELSSFYTSLGFRKFQHFGMVAYCKQR